MVFLLGRIALFTIIPVKLPRRKAKTKFKVSGGTRSDCGRVARDTFLSLQQTCLKLGINFIEFLHDRVKGLYKIPRLAEIIRQHAIQAFRVIIFRCASSALAALVDKRKPMAFSKTIVLCKVSMLTRRICQRIAIVFTGNISDVHHCGQLQKQKIDHLETELIDPDISSFLIEPPQIYDRTDSYLVLTA